MFIHSYKNEIAKVNFEKYMSSFMIFVVLITHTHSTKHKYAHIHEDGDDEDDEGEGVFAGGW